jgi:hypothetical protein
MTSPGNGLLYEVKLSNKIKETIKELHQRLAHQGKGQRFLDSLRAIHNRLQQDPTNFGEPLYQLPALRLLVYQVVASGIVVYYGVHEEKPLVFLKGVQLL